MYRTQGVTSEAALAPVSMAAFRNGLCNLGSFCWGPGMTDWEKVWHVPELRGVYFALHIDKAIWEYQKEGQRGPARPSELTAMLQAGELTVKNCAWTEGLRTR
jgi:hypothetical protein